MFDEQNLRALSGDMAIGHVRYSTTGGGAWENAQPVWRDDGRELALAHNGNLTNAVELYNQLTEAGIKLRGTSDSEIMASLLSRRAGEGQEWIEDAVAEVMPKLEGAYSTVVMTKHAVVAFRDPHGVRPLALGKIKAQNGFPECFVVASESCAFDIIGAQLIREVQPGELVSLTARGLEMKPVITGERLSQCVFEHIYFATSRQPRRERAPGPRKDGPSAGRRRPGGRRRGDPGAGLRDLDGQRVRQGGAACRRIWADQEPLRGPHLHLPPEPSLQALGSISSPLPRDRGRQAGGRGGRLDRPGQHHPGQDPGDTEGAGAKEVHLRICAADPVPVLLRDRLPHQRGDDRHGRTVEEIAEELGADSLAYLLIDAVYEAVGTPREKHCDACFTGEYPPEIREAANDKFAIEDIAVVPSGPQAAPLRSGG